MTDSTVTISSKSSPYHSQIHPRLASPGSSSLIGSYVSSHHPSVSNEKSQLQKLNDQFLSYIERVRLFETYNNCLTSHCEQIQTAQERTKHKLDALQQEFDEYQQERFTREKKDIQLEIENVDQLEKQMGEFKNKQKRFQNEHEFYRKQIVDLQKQSVDLQSKTENLRSDYENINDDNQHYRKKISYYQSLKSSILDEIARQRDANQRLQSEVDDLKIQKQLSIQAHDADTQAIEIHNDNILYDLTTSFRFDGNGKNVLTQMLNEIREEYKHKDHEMREELHRKYLYEYNQHIKKQVDRNLIETSREDNERRHLANELNSLNDNRILLRQKLALIQEHSKQLESNVERETKKRSNLHEKYEQQIGDLRASVQEYENLLNNTSFIRQPTLDDEMNKYRQLLEGSDQHVGLRQLINMSNKIDRFSPINRPPTPPPPAPSSSSSPPPPPSKLESAAVLLPLLSLTRQNSASEASYDTALISQSSTTTTNYQYLTLESLHDKSHHSDYDTDNDQSQTIQYMSGRSSRLISETDTTPSATTPTNQESLPPLPLVDLINYDQICIDASYTDAPINQTLPFVPMNIVLPVDTDEIKNIIADEQQSPLISTLEKRDEVEKTITGLTPSTTSETMIPITIVLDSKLAEDSIESKIVSPLTPTISVDEQPKLVIAEEPIPVQSETESTAVEIPVSTLPTTNPLAKLISTMLPNVNPFVPGSNGTSNRPVSPSPIPISTMSNDAQAFVPNQHQFGNGQQNANQSGAGHWNGAGQRGVGGGNRRGQTGGGAGFHQGGSGGGNQRSGGGGNWQQGGGRHQQRRGPK